MPSRHDGAGHPGRWVAERRSTAPACAARAVRHGSAEVTIDRGCVVADVGRIG
jgi:hypothetical protein